jgi:hypothetical protein
LIIKVQLFAHRNNSTGVDAKKHKDKERERIMQQYFFNGHQICRKTFLGFNPSLSSDLDMDSSWDLPMAWANENVFLHIW